MQLTRFPATVRRGELGWLPGDCFVAIHLIPEATIRLNSRLGKTSTNATTTTFTCFNAFGSDSFAVDLVLSNSYAA